jgi:hypothetical protein
LVNTGSLISRRTSGTASERIPKIKTPAHEGRRFRYSAFPIRKRFTDTPAFENDGRDDDERRLP